MLSYCMLVLLLLLLLHANATYANANCYQLPTAYCQLLLPTTATACQCH